eukprot:m.31330 g.31330  ORF g.31330 m.31330 type:complete len:541 (+) comp8305_c0_seq1:93-1715(+)
MAARECLRFGTLFILVGVLLATGQIVDDVQGQCFSSTTLNLDSPPSYFRVPRISGLLNVNEDDFNRVLTWVGDVNGDGVNDMLISSSGESVNRVNNAGRVYLVFGSPTITSQDWDIAELVESKLASVLSVENPPNYYYFLGFSMHGAGDVNGDGLSDFLISAWSDCYLVYGSRSFPLKLDLSKLNSSIGSKLSDRPNCAKVGDINGDGFNDIVSWKQTYVNNRTHLNVLSMHVVMGSNNLPSNMTEFSVEVKLKMSRDFSDDITVNAAGDINGDGYDDMMISHLGQAVYMVYGHADISDNSPILLEESDKVTVIVSPQSLPETLFGSDVSPLGDFNGDGLDDVIIGTPREQPMSFILLGNRNMPSRINVTDTHTKIDVLQLLGGSGEGHPVRGAGDVNGDGLKDVIIGCVCKVTARNGVYRAGIAHIVYGQRNFPKIFDLRVDINGRNGFAIEGNTPEGFIGYTVDGPGDIDNDGLDDVLIGALDSNTNPSNASAYIISPCMPVEKTTTTMSYFAQKTTTSTIPNPQDCKCVLHGLRPTY